ncbi:C-C motif chemokine 20-like [Scomber japonicus]|uniref:C-C motif chemokine 20-like n=1 Tax=Scomber japonicus TaxID=13676 RepID=UPI0023068CD0|nr:C-C motif chemokine 20-like [Scomber japonicus]
MVLRGMITGTTVLLCLVLGLLSPAPAALGSYSGRGCCTRYNRKPVPFQRIKGYREQTVIENCRIEAIIFYTIKNLEICATRKDEWVRKNLELLSSKLKKMSKTSTAAGEAITKRHGNPTIKDGDGSVLNTTMNTTETFANSTERFY